jgi:hypothetical protein
LNIIDIVAPLTMVMRILLWLTDGRTAWWIFGYYWLKFFVGDETEEYEECPYE